VRVDATVASDEQLARLPGRRFGRVVQLAETTSTNAVLTVEAQGGAPEGLVVVADHQTAGRGRFDRRWESPPGTSLLLSLLARPPIAELPPARRHLAVAAVSLSVVEAARTVAGVELVLKWPNDVISLGPPRPDSKVAGVLAETAPAADRPAAAAAGPAIVIGVGINVGWAPEGVSATCLDRLAGHPVDRGELLIELLCALDRLYGRWDEVARLYRRYCATLGRQVTVSFATPISGPPAFAGSPGTPLSGSPAASGPHAGRAPDLHGKAVDVDGDGRLVVEIEDGLGPTPSDRGRRVAVAAGDVTHATVALPPGPYRTSPN
jgi:BirA family biotin operon repressor/biotin-[acetyl-CoA-carboxylase] ligase